MKHQKGKALIQTWFQRVWSDKDASAIDELYAGGKVRGLGTQTMLGQEDFKEFHEAMCSRLADIEITIDKYMEDGDWGSALCTLNAKSRGVGHRVSITGNVWLRISEGKIQEAYNHFDFLGLWSQLGYLPMDSFEQGLRGHIIA